MVKIGIPDLIRRGGNYTERQKQFCIICTTLNKESEPIEHSWELKTALKAGKF